MATVVHFIDVGQGNMTLLQLANGKVFLYDCNVTDANEDRVLEYVANKIGWGTSIDVFVCSHRDADHMRGIQRVNMYFPILEIWDTGVTGTTPGTIEYRRYMDLRRQIGCRTIKARTYYDYGNTRLRIMNAENDDLPNNPNAQSVVIKVVQQHAARGIDYASAMLTGDTDAVTWRHIQKHYTRGDLSSSILLAGHHGSITFFDNPSDEEHYYVAHVRAMTPDMTIVSVGPNSHGHPDAKALELYQQYTKGSRQGNKVFRTDTQGTLRLTLKDGGGWSLTPNST